MKMMMMMMMMMSLNNNNNNDGTGFDSPEITSAQCGDMKRIQ
jgi:hypothetical protein